jgi:hypothetical protein
MPLLCPGVYPEGVDLPAFLSISDLHRLDSNCPLSHFQIEFLAVSASHTLTVLSKLPETMRVPSGENATLLTPPVCPRRE